MFQLFKKKSKIDKLQIKYESLMKEAFILSTTNRRESDKIIAKAEVILKEIEVEKSKK